MTSDVEKRVETGLIKVTRLWNFARYRTRIQSWTLGWLFFFSCVKIINSIFLSACSARFSCSYLDFFPHATKIRKYAFFSALFFFITNGAFPSCNRKLIQFRRSCYFNLSSSSVAFDDYFVVTFAVDVSTIQWPPQSLSTLLLQAATVIKHFCWVATFFTRTFDDAYLTCLNLFYRISTLLHP